MGDGNRSSRPPHGQLSQSKNRTGEPVRVVVVPPGYRRFTLNSERERLRQEWKLNTGCDITVRHGEGKIFRFDVYGTGANLERALQEINQWILAANDKSTGSAAWAKLSAFDYNKWYYDEVREMESRRKEMFKGPIPEDMEVPFKIPVPWPDDLYGAGVVYEDMFGIGLELLDFIRVNDEVFINSISNVQFEIRGFSIAQVEAAEKHLNTMIQKVRTQTFGATRPLHIILDEAEGIEIELKDIALDKTESWWPHRASHSIVPRLVHHPMMNVPGDFRRDELHPAQLSVIQHALEHALESIKYEKGYYDLFVRFGCLAISSKNLSKGVIEQKHDKSSFFESVIGHGDFEAKKWLCDENDGCALLARFVQADYMFEPTKSAGYFGHTPETLKDIRPVFRGRWAFKDPNAPRIAEPQPFVRHHGKSKSQKQQIETEPKGSPSEPLCVVQIDWTDDEEGMYEKTDIRYFQLQPGHAGPKENINVKLMELAESKAWQISLESMTPISKKLVSPALRAFAEQVRMVGGYQISSNKIFADWKVSHLLSLQTGRLDKIYSFGIRNTCYKVEAVQMWYPQHKLPCWGINVRHAEWATHLAQLEQLRVGITANWGDSIATFLPDDGLTSAIQDASASRKDNGLAEPARDGIRKLINTLMRVSTIINYDGGIPIGPTDVQNESQYNLMD